MNPFTKHLRQGSTDDEFARFITLWDRLERLVIDVYKAKQSTSTADADFRLIWSQLRIEYPVWEQALHPFWTLTRAAGEATRTDPFLLLLAIENADAIPGDWRAMQHLPAAREAINRYLLEHGKNGPE